MSTKDYLCRHFSRMGVRLLLREAVAHQGAKVRINVGRDRSGEFFDIRCHEGVALEILDVQPTRHHLVLMARDGTVKNKFLLGRDERHWFAAAVPGDNVHDVRTAIESLRPVEAVGKKAVRQGEWFFVAERDASDVGAIIYRNEPLSRGAGSKPHVCEELMRRGGTTVMVCPQYPTGVSPMRYERLITSDPAARNLPWRRMRRDAEVYVRGDVRHRDHKTISLEGWHRVFMNRERFRAARAANCVSRLDSRAFQFCKGAPCLTNSRLT